MPVAERKPDGEDTAAAQFAFDTDRAAVLVDQFVDQSEPDSATLERPALGAFDPVEPFKQPRQFMARDAAARVANGEFRGCSILHRANFDGNLSLERELERVGHEIEHNLFPHLAVDIDGMR